MHTDIISFSTDLVSKVVRCVEDAVGDDIQADIQRNDLQTRNSVPSRIWDFLNTNVVKVLDIEDCTIAKAHRGPWEMLVIFEKSTQCILTFMREKRFAELQKRQRQRKRMHYIDMMARQFNQDLLVDQQQLCLIPHQFSDEERLAELVQTLLRDLGSDADLVRHHVLRFLYKGIIIKHNKTEPTYTKTSLFLCEKRRFFMARTEKGVVATI